MPSPIRYVPALFSALAWFSPTTPLFAQVPTESVLPQLHLANPAELPVFVATPGDGRTWARGHDWKASFGADGFTFVPFLGSKAPRNFPLQLRLISARSGTTALPLDLDRTAAAHGNQRVAIDRGALVEVYDLDARHVEQRFVFAEPLGAGELAVTMAVATELVAEAHVDGSFTFRGEWGGVHVGKATAVDARGATCAASSTLGNGNLTLCVPAEFVASAVWPLTIDPLFLTFGLQVPPSSYDHVDADVAYVASHDGLYATVFEEIYSASDHDIQLRAFRRDGSLAAAGYVDVTSTTWHDPRIASNASASQFLCVARRGATGAHGCLVDFTAPLGVPTLGFGSQFGINTGFAVATPDVGGDPTIGAALPGHYCVAYDHAGQIAYTLVRTDGVVMTPGGVPVSSAFANARRPALSKCCTDEAPIVQDWVLVWEQDASASNQDIYAAYVRSNGALSLPAFLVDGSPLSDTRPEVSSKTDIVGGVDRWMVVWQRAIPGGPITFAHDDVYGAIYDGSGVNLTGSVDLTSLLNRPIVDNQWNPCVDTDGTRFAVGFSEDPSIFTAEVFPFLATVHLTNAMTIGVSAYPELLNGSVDADDHLRITAEHSGGTYTSRYMAVWDVTNPTTNLQSTLGAFYRGHQPHASYFQVTAPGCGAMTILPYGLPAIGETFVLDLVNAQGLPLLLIGAPITPYAFCPGCQVGVDLATVTVLFTPSFVLTVPQYIGLLGYQLAAQGVDAFAPGGCATPFALTATDAVVVTIL